MVCITKGSVQLMDIDDGTSVVNHDCTETLLYGLLDEDELHYVDPGAPGSLELSAEVIVEGGNSATVVTLGFWSRLVQRLIGGLQEAEVLDTSQNLRSRTTLKIFGNENEVVLRGLGFPVMVNIPSFRVVSTIWGRHAEYEVRVVAGGKEMSSWRRFSDFKHMVIDAKLEDKCARDWDKILLAQPSHRCLRREYLAFKCSLLEAFMQELVFSMDTPEILMRFITNNH